MELQPDLPYYTVRKGVGLQPEYTKEWVRLQPEYTKEWVGLQPEYTKEWVGLQPEYTKEWGGAATRFHDSYTKEGGGSAMHFSAIWSGSQVLKPGTPVPSSQLSNSEVHRLV